VRPRSIKAFTEDLEETLIKLRSLSREAKNLDVTVCLKTDYLFGQYSHRFTYLDELGSLQINSIRQTTEYYKDTD
jgi:hypothetical protein